MKTVENSAIKIRSRRRNLLALKPYPSYKDSGVPWLGKVPEGWEVKPLKRLSKLPPQYGANIPANMYTNEDEGVRLIRTTDIDERGGLKEKGVWAPKNLVKNHLLNPGDLLLSRSGTIGLALLIESPLIRAEDKFAFAGYLVRFALRKDLVCPKYVFFFTRSQDFRRFVGANAISSTIDNVNAEKYANMPLPLPSLPEQRAIVKFLDWAERRIRFIIAARKRRIQLLEEYRQALINDAVTGKFDVRTGKPYPSYKDSGVRWLGKVPKHWKARKLRHVLNRIDVRNRPDMPLLSVVREKGVILRDITNKDENHNFIPDDLSNYKVVYQGQFVINKMKAWQGSYGVSHYDGIVSPAYFVFDIQGVEGKFLHAALRSKGYIPFFMQASKGVRVGQWDLSIDQLKEIPFYLPPLPEQRAIAEYLDRETAKIDAAIEKTKESIALWEELRETLISDVVTGKLDVREAAKKLPEAEPELEAKLEALEAALKEKGRAKSPEPYESEYQSKKNPA